MTGSAERASVSVSLPRLGGWRVKDIVQRGTHQRVSVSLPRLGGWRAHFRPWPSPSIRGFSLVAEIGWLARVAKPVFYGTRQCFSLVAEIGWLARLLTFFLRTRNKERFSLVAEIGWLASDENGAPHPAHAGVSVSLPRLGGWRDGGLTPPIFFIEGFSLVAEIGWLASRGARP